MMEESAARFVFRAKSNFRVKIEFRIRPKKTRSRAHAEKKRTTGTENSVRVPDNMHVYLKKIRRLQAVFFAHAETRNAFPRLPFAF